MRGVLHFAEVEGPDGPDSPDGSSGPYVRSLFFLPLLGVGNAVTASPLQSRWHQNEEFD